MAFLQLRVRVRVQDCEYNDYGFGINIGTMMADGVTDSYVSEVALWVAYGDWRVSRPRRVVWLWEVLCAFPPSSDPMCDVPCAIMCDDGECSLFWDVTISF